MFSAGDTTSPTVSPYGTSEVLPRVARPGHCALGRVADRCVFVQLIKYGTAGAVGTAVQYAILVGLVEGFGSDAVLASTLGAVAGAVVNYVLNYRYTFKSRRPHTISLAKYMVVSAGGHRAQRGGAGCRHVVSRACITLARRSSRRWSSSSRRSPSIACGRSDRGASTGMAPTRPRTRKSASIGSHLPILMPPFRNRRRKRTGTHADGYAGRDVSMRRTSAAGCCGCCSSRSRCASRRSARIR